MSQTSGREITPLLGTLNRKIREPMSKLAIITGADGGMGTEITRAVAQAGYHVIMLCYTLFKGEERKNQLILETGNKEIEVRQVDLSSMASVTNIADDLLGRGKHIDLLMNNAGTMSSGGLITTEDGLEYTVHSGLRHGWLPSGHGAGQRPLHR